MVGGSHMRQQACDLVASVRQLCQETKIFLSERLEEAKLPADVEEKLVSVMTTLEEEIRKCFDLQSTGDDEQEHKRTRGLFKLKFKRAKTASSSSSSSSATQHPAVKTEPSLSISSGGGTTDDGSGVFVQCRSGSPAMSPSTTSPEKVLDTSSHQRTVYCWTAEEVASWLAEVQMKEYQENFLRHDIRGSELLSLERRDLKELGVTKVGHIKRILQAVADIKQMPQRDADSARK